MSIAVLSTKLKKSIGDLDTATSIFFGVYGTRRVYFDGSLIDFYLISSSNLNEPIGDLGNYGTIRLRRLDDKLTRFEIFESAYPPNESFIFDYLVMRKIMELEKSDYKVRIVKSDYSGYFLACTLAQWKKFLGDALYSLTMDHIIGGARLSENVLSSLEIKAKSLGMARDKLLELLKKSWATEHFVKKDWDNLKLIWGNAIHEGRREYLSRAKDRLINSLKEDDLWETDDEILQKRSGELEEISSSSLKFESKGKLSNVEKPTIGKKARDLPNREPYRTRWINIWRLVESRVTSGDGIQETYGWLSSKHYEVAINCSLDTFRDIVNSGLAEKIPPNNSR